MSRLRHIAPTALALLAPILAGCGGAVSTGNLKGESKAVAQRIADFQTDVTGSEAKKLCNQDFARTVAERLRATGTSCTQALKSQLGAIDDYELTLETVSVTGKTATARVKSTWSGKTRMSTLKLVKEDGTWKISGLA